MGNTSTIVTGIETTLASVFTSFTKANFGIDIQKNSWKHGKSVYSVVPQSSSQGNSTTCAITMEQSFLVTIADQFKSERTDDSSKQSKIISLTDSAMDFFKALVKNKAFAPSVVLNIYDLEIQDPEFLEDENIVLIKMSFIVLNRTQL